jgi:LL-diaminopimelate aminotransferase
MGAMKIELANRIRELPPYLFAQIDALKQEQRKKGRDLIDLGIGDPDLPTPPHIVDALAAAASEGRNHRYPSYVGMFELRNAAAGFMHRRFDVTVDPELEVICSIGSKEAIAHFPFAFVNPGDVVLCPDPGYPVYATLTRFAGGDPFFLPLKRAANFLPDLDAVPADVARRAKILWINYPNNPTAALAAPGFYERVVAFAQKNDVIVASDLAYSEMYYEAPPPSFLATPGAREVGIEFHTLSKTYNMTGWRVGWAAGNGKLIAGLGQVKTNVDSGCFDAIQYAAIAALTGDQGCVARQREIYRERRDVLCGGLARAGFDVLTPKASFYALVANPGRLTSLEFTAKLLTEAGVVATPATGFGPSGEGFVRLTVCADKARLAEAVERIKALAL